MKKFIFSLLFSALLTSPALAQESDPAPVKGNIALGIGAYDALDDETTADFRLEYRQEESLFIQGLKPWIGAELTGENTMWGGGGFLYDWNVYGKIHLVPSVGLGLYFQGDSDLDLGHLLEFRTQIEAAYEINERKDRIGLAFSHMSNKGMHSRNPGTEIINAYYQYGF